MPELLVLLPVYEDWESLSFLLPQLDATLTRAGREASVIVVNDGSRTQPERFSSEPLSAIKSIDVLSLTRNVGHQRAIAIGLSYLAAERTCNAVIVMDADGEDLPSDVPRLLAAWDAQMDRAVFAQRTRRSEGIVFTVFYQLYRVAHRLMTGIPVEVGNFSVLPCTTVRKLSVVSEMWNHYAAAVVHAKFPRVLVPAARGKRLKGRSKLGFVSLVGHGLSAMSVFADRIAVRMLALTGVLVALFIAGVAGLIAFRFAEHVAMTTALTLTLALLGVLISQAVLLAITFAFIVQSSRAQSTFIPARDFAFYIESCRRVYPAST